jgi:hypothetical protein
MPSWLNDLRTSPGSCSEPQGTLSSEVEAKYIIDQSDGYFTSSILFWECALPGAETIKSPLFLRLSLIAPQNDAWAVVFLMSTPIPQKCLGMSGLVSIFPR